MRTDDLIKALSEDRDVAASFHSRFALATAAGAAIAAVIFLLGIGMRPDVSQAAGTMRFQFKFLVTLTLAVTAIGLALRMALPGAPQGRWRWALGLAPALLVAAVIFELLAMPEPTWKNRWMGTNAPYCMTLIPLLAVGPLACFLLVLRQGAPEKPGIAGAVAGLAASGIAATFYASHCPDDSPLFVATWYPLATGIVALTGYLIGRRVLRW